MFLRWWGIVVANTKALNVFDRSNIIPESRTERNDLHLGILTSQVRFRACGMMYVKFKFGCLSMSALYLLYLVSGSDKTATIQKCIFLAMHPGQTLIPFQMRAISSETTTRGRYSSRHEYKLILWNFLHSGGL